MQKIFWGINLAAILTAVFFLVAFPRHILLVPTILSPTIQTLAGKLPLEPEGAVPVLSLPVSSGEDLPPQPQLAERPEVIKAIYVTSWVAGIPERTIQLQVSHFANW